MLPSRKAIKEDVSSAEKERMAEFTRTSETGVYASLLARFPPPQSNDC